MRDLEHQLQVKCVKWFKQNYANKIIYAIPNGAARNIITAKHLKDEGVLSGVPDLHIPYARNGYHSLYIEMKNGKAGRLSENQFLVIEELRKEGNRVEVVRFFEEFVSAIQSYLVDETCTLEDRIKAQAMDDAVESRIKMKLGQEAVMPIAQELEHRRFHRGCGRKRNVNFTIEEYNNFEVIKKHSKQVKDESKRDILPDCGCK